MMNYKNYRKLYGTAKWQRIRKQVFQRDGYRCTHCGKAGSLEAHHNPSLIDRPAVDVDEFYNPEKIKTVCRLCHIREHQVVQDPDRRAWQEYIDNLK